MKKRVLVISGLFVSLSLTSYSWAEAFGDVDPSRTVPDEGSRVPIEIELYWCGDTNDDGTVTTGDGYNILNWFGNTGTILDLRTADINGDGNLTTADGFFFMNYFGSNGMLC